MTRRTLALRKETLTELTADDLRQVAAGQAMSGAPCNSTESLIPTCGCTGYYPSIFDPCLSWDVCVATH